MIIKLVRYDMSAITYLYAFGIGETYGVPVPRRAIRTGFAKDTDAQHRAAKPELSWR